LFIAMRYVAGPDLGKVLKERRRLEPDEALSLLGQAARALDAAHDGALVHLDVKPANILIERGREGDPDHVYVTDFGNANRLLSQTGVSGTGGFVGPVDYIAPELIQGHRVDGRADVYSLACILHECLTGGVPFDTGGEAGLGAHLQGQPAD